MNKRPTVIDLFCGAGGFSEGFRQQGFKIIAGYDHWRPAVDTFEYNFGNKRGFLRNILDFEKNEESIELLPDTDVIIGSPPCVSFSNSNRSGKTDKTMGIRLTKSFLRVIAIKKYKQGSTLKAWFMENVPKSIEHVSKDYSFYKLGLKNWALANGYDPKMKAICLKKNHVIVNSADFGCPQQRIRALAGEIFSVKASYLPERTHKHPKEKLELPNYMTLGYIKSKLPKPNQARQDNYVSDPLYPTLRIKDSELTDHFYDSGLYRIQWETSYFMKRNHPYMGRMAFPENMNNPSRTITATNIGTSREALIYESEYNRRGDGEYRVPTVREMACLMGFPISFQFLGKGESAKCRLIGNAVCPSLSRALAKKVGQELMLNAASKSIGKRNFCLDKITDLNSFKEKSFSNPPKKKNRSRFRRHPFKYGNITVSLSNYDILTNASSGKWITSVQYGNGNGFPTNSYPNNFYKRIAPIICEFEGGIEFLTIINNGFSERIANGKGLQEMYENHKSKNNYLEPTELIDEVARIVDNFDFEESDFIQSNIIVFAHKNVVPKKQVLALYAINKISTIANVKKDE